MTAANAESVSSLMSTLRGDDVQAACDAAQSLALLGDRSIIPSLIQEREAIRSELNSGERLIDASEERREMALTMAIVSLLTPAERETLLETGNEFEKSMVRQRRTAASVEDFWGPLRD